MKDLRTLYKYSKQEYNKRCKYMYELKLKDFNENKICVSITPEVMNLVRNVSYLKVDKNYNEDILLLDSTSSATIEGAKTTVEAVKRAVLSGRPSRSDKMVLNIIKAQSTYMQRGIHCEADINHLWSIIVDDVLENTSVKGVKYRSGMVYISGLSGIAHTPCPVDLIEDCMQSLISFINRDTINPLLKAVVCHFYYVYIHPMCDGNGRTARSLQSIILEQFGYTDLKRLPIITTINKNLNEYYSSLRKAECVVNGIMDITPFVDYILRMILMAYSSHSMGGLSNTEIKLLNKIPMSNSITVSKAVRITGLSETYTRDILNRLVKEGYFIKLKQGNKNIYTRVR